MSDKIAHSSDRFISLVRLNETCYEEIKKDILSGVLTHGTKIEINLLAEQFRVSLAPIVKALDALARDGLVEVRPNRGSFVRMPTADDIAEISEVRIGLELAACRLAMEKSPRKLGKALRSLQRSARDEFAVDRTDVGELERAFFTYDRRFHRAIAEGAENGRLLIMFEVLRDQVELFRAYFDADGARQAFVEHERVVQAVENNDSAAACGALQAHILQVQKDTIRDFQMRHHVPGKRRA